MQIPTCFSYAETVSIKLVQRWKVANNYLCLTLITILSLYSCKRIPETSGRYDYLNLENNSSKSSNPLQYQMDSIIIRVDFDEAVNSMLGYFFAKDNMLCFADRGVRNVIVYDTLGRYQHKAVMNGRGHNEVLDLFVASTNDDGQVLILDSNWNFYKYDTNWNRGKIVHMDFNKSCRSLNDILKHPDPNNYDMYEIAYDNCLVKLYDGDYALFPITTEHPDYNAYQGYRIKHFFKNSHILGMINLNDSTMGMFGHFSPWYIENDAASFIGVIQIYYNMSMIGEITVPKDTYYIGYIDGYSYFTSFTPNTLDERFIIYRYQFNR